MALAQGQIDEINDDIIPLLSNERAEVRYQTLDFFLGLTASEETLSFFRDHVKCLEAIAKLTKETETEFSRLVYKTLVNLSADETVCETLIKLKQPSDFIYSLISYVGKPESQHADLVCSVLCNLTRWEKSANHVVVVIKTHEDISFGRLVQIICTDEYNKSFSLDLLAMVLSNLSQIAETRKYILDKEKCVIQRLLPYSHYQGSVIKRRGVVATLKNCCFEGECHDWLLSDKVDILPSLLLPLSGPETFDDDDMEKLPLDLQYLSEDKTREPEPEIRTMLVEAVFQLCATKKGRKFIKDKNTYVIMRELDRWEENPTAKIAIEKVISLLIGDEPAAEHENLQEVDVPEHLQKQFEKESEEFIKEQNISDPNTEVLLMNS